MSILATIKDHSGRIYRGIQSLLLLAIGATAMGALGISRNLSSGGAFAISIVATALALMALMYMRSNIVQRLRSAAAAEAECDGRLRAFLIRLDACSHIDRARTTAAANRLRHQTA